jgi:histone-lysine N-methyltransferase SETD3
VDRQVLKERVAGERSFFADYINNLPAGVPGLPMFFSPAAVKALEQYPPLRQIPELCHPTSVHIHSSGS